MDDLLSSVYHHDTLTCCLSLGDESPLPCIDRSSDKVYLSYHKVGRRQIKRLPTSIDLNGCQNQSVNQPTYLQSHLVSIIPLLL